MVGWWRVKSTYKRSDRRAIVGSGGFTMYKRAGDSSLGTISASSPVLREKKRQQSALVHCGRRVWRVRRSSSWSAAQRSHGSHPSACMFAPRRRLDVFIDC